MGIFHAALLPSHSGRQHQVLSMITNAAFSELRHLLDSNRPEEAKEALRNLQAGYFSLLDEIDHLHLRITSFEDLLCLSKVRRGDDDLIWFSMPDSMKKAGPFCPLCHDTDNSLIHLEKNGDDWLCPSCHAQYQGEGNSRKKAALLPFDKAARLVRY